MRVRERIEDQEYLLLSPLAAKSREAQRDREQEECPFRTKFQRDRDRILHSKAFRRLKHKTQVFIVSGDHYRTRMTHSLEVAQIGRTIARGLSLNEDLTEAIALGHDVGHTPFGHSGESALNRLCGHFAHNEQSLRVLKYLEKNGQGLNLTHEVQDGILHHSGAVLPSTMEGRIVHWADRIAYLCHDLDDSMRAGLLSVGDLPELVQKHIGTATDQMITAMVADVICQSEKAGDIVFSQAMTEAMSTFRTFMFQNIYHSKALARERWQGVFVLEQLYKYFMDDSSHLPVEFQQREQKWGLQQTVVDYVAGLTDSYAVQLFNHIFMPPVGEMVR